MFPFWLPVVLITANRENTYNPVENNTQSGYGHPNTQDNKRKDGCGVRQEMGKPYTVLSSPKDRRYSRQ